MRTIGKENRLLELNSTTLKFGSCFVITPLIFNIRDMKGNKVIFRIEFTLSKIGGLLLIIGGITLGFLAEEQSVTISLCTLGAGMITAKTIVQGKR